MGTGGGAEGEGTDHNRSEMLLHCCYPDSLTQQHYEVSERTQSHWDTQSWLMGMQDDIATLKNKKSHGSFLQRKLTTQPHNATARYSPRGTASRM